MFVEYTAGQCDIIPGFRLELDSVCVCVCVVVEQYSLFYSNELLTYEL